MAKKRENRESTVHRAAASFSSKLVGADRGVEKKLVAIKINYMHRNGR